jgi:hypothetical protein
LTPWIRLCLQCPVAGFECESQAIDVALAAALTTALQMHNNAIHIVQLQAQPKAQNLKLNPPLIAYGCDPDQWSAFVRQWEMYKLVMAIANNVLTIALFYCCDDDWRTYLMRDIRGDVATMLEAGILAAKTT